MIPRRLFPALMSPLGTESSRRGKRRPRSLQPCIATLWRHSRNPPLKENLERLGAVLVGSTPAQLADLLDTEMKRWEPVIRESGIKLD
jgi:hypothetical protein